MRLSFVALNGTVKLVLYGSAVEYHIKPPLWGFNLALNGIPTR